MKKKIISALISAALIVMLGILNACGNKDTPTDIAEKYKDCSSYEEIAEKLRKLSKKEFTKEVKYAFEQLDEGAVPFACVLCERANEYSEEEIISMIKDSENDLSMRTSLVDIYTDSKSSCFEDKTEKGVEELKSMLSDSSVEDYLKSFIVTALDFSGDNDIALLRTLAGSDDSSLASHAQEKLKGLEIIPMPPNIAMKNVYRILTEEDKMKLDCTWEDGAIARIVFDASDAEGYMKYAKNANGGRETLNAEQYDKKEVYQVMFKTTDGTVKIIADLKTGRIIGISEEELSEEDIVKIVYSQLSERDQKETDGAWENASIEKTDFNSIASALEEKTDGIREKYRCSTVYLVSFPVKDAKLCIISAVDMYTGKIIGYMPTV